MRRAHSSQWLEVVSLPKSSLLAYEEVTTGAEGSAADLWVKSGANISNLTQEMQDTFETIVNRTAALNLPHPVITSGNDSTHGQNSLHYSNNAIDIRANNISDAEAQQLRNSIAAALGSDYDVIFEHNPATPQNDHIHIEYDP